jgi:hypothetical protein
VRVCSVCRQETKNSSDKPLLASRLRLVKALLK